MSLKNCYIALLLAFPAFSQAQSDCHNVLTGGLICCDQTVCPGKAPQIITESQPPEGGEGLVEYEWHRLRVLPNEAPLWEVIPGAVNADYQPDTLSATTYFLREVRRQGCDDWMVSNIVTITVPAPDDPGCAGSVSTQDVISGLASVRCTPSPFTEHLTLRNDARQQVSICIFDAFGKQVTRLALGAGTQTALESLSWSAGLYMVRLEGANGEKTTRTIVKTAN